jgi:hypothetical protein
LATPHLVCRNANPNLTMPEETKQSKIGLGHPQILRDINLDKVKADELAISIPMSDLAWLFRHGK